MEKEEKTDLVVEETPETTEIVEETPEVIEEAPIETEVESEEKKSDAVSEAMEQNKKLKEELEELKANTSNVFEDNAILKQELEDQKKLAEMAKENAEIREQLDNIKRTAIIDEMMATGKINGDLKEWAQELSLPQLEKFMKNAPKMKTILDEINDAATSSPSDEMEKWHADQMKSRIIN